MLKAKYLVLRQGGFEVPFIFSELNDHANTASKLGGEVVGAGFCYIREDRYHCYGKSVSLKIESRGDVDASILNRLLGIETNEL